MRTRLLLQIAALAVVAAILWALSEINLQVHALPLFIGVLLLLSVGLVSAVLWLEPKDKDE